MAHGGVSDERGHAAVGHTAENPADIACVKIDASLPPAQRVRSFVRQIGNPYCFRCGKLTVRLSFPPDGPALNDLLSRYFIHLKGG